MSKRNITTFTLSAVLSATAFFTFFSQPAAAQAPAPTPSLKEIYKDDFLIGTAIDIPANNGLSPSDFELIKSQFNIITPENSMKPQSVHPAEDRYTFESADNLVKWTAENNIKVWGHTLVWHSQTANWFFEGENGQPVTREKALERLKKHITDQVGRYKGKVMGWDVVNEAINDQGPADIENLRTNAPWYRAVGPDYLTSAFKYAREADPDVQLYYNDYNIEKGNKHQNSLLLLKRLIKDGAPIQGVGIQGHWGLNNLPYEEIDKAISNYAALGLKVSITELDITIQGTGGGQLNPNFGGPATAPGAGRGGAGFAAGGPAGPATGPATQGARRGPRGAGGPGGRGGPTAPLTAEQLQAQADAYAKLFAIFLKHKDVIDRVTFWGINDGRSWRRGQAPLLHDGENKPKPAFNAVVAAKK